MIRILAICLTLALSISNASAGRYKDCDQRKDVDRSIRACTAIIEAQNESPGRRANAHKSRGRAYFDKRETERAIADFDKAIEIEPEYTEAYHNRGMAYERKGDLERAFTEFNKAIAIDPTLAPPYFGRARIHFLRKAFDDAVADYTKFIDMSAKTPTAKHWDGRVNFWRGQAYYWRGVAYYEAGSTRHRVRDINRGITYDGRGNLDPAIEDFNKALESEPNNSRIYFARGRAYHQSNQLDNAIADYSKAIALHRRDSSLSTHVFYMHSFYVNRAAAYREIGEVKKAKADTDRADEIMRALKRRASPSGCR